MLDTVRLGFSEVELDPGVLLARGWTRAQFDRNAAEGMTESLESYSLRRKNESPHFLSWSPKSGRLKLETSFPKLLYGNNVELVRAEDVRGGLDKLSDIVTSCAGKPVDAREGEIQGRVDFVFSFDATWGGDSHVGDYLSAFRSLELPRHYQESVAKDSTLYWRNKVRVIRLYDKFKESEEDAAKGALRFEVQENHAKAELETLVPDLGGMKLEQIARWDVAKKVLSHYLEAMGADLIVGDERRLASKLIAELGPARARRLMGYVVYLRLYGHAGMNDLGFDRKMPWRDRKELERIGVSGALGSADCGVLPPLTLPEKYTGESLKLGV